MSGYLVFTPMSAYLFVIRGAVTSLSPEERPPRFDPDERRPRCHADERLPRMSP